MPINCVLVEDNSLPCSSSGGPDQGLSCHDNGTANFGKCCTTIPWVPQCTSRDINATSGRAPPTRTVRPRRRCKTFMTIEEVHLAWHNCFGATGNTAVPPRAVASADAQLRRSPEPSGAWLPLVRVPPPDDLQLRPFPKPSAAQQPGPPQHRVGALGARRERVFRKTCTRSIRATSRAATWNSAATRPPSGAAARSMVPPGPIGGPPCDDCVDYPQCLNFFHHPASNVGRVLRHRRHQVHSYGDQPRSDRALRAAEQRSRHRSRLPFLRHG